jgi:hypothetical protein
MLPLDTFGHERRRFLLRRHKSSAGNGILPERRKDGDTLDKIELASRFAEVLEHYRTTNEMAQEEVCFSMLRSRLPNLRLNRCFVGPSGVPAGGQGLFASRNVNDGELITLYPGDALLVWNTTVVGDFSQDVGVMFGNHVQEMDRNPDRVCTDQARSYELQIRTGYSIVADPLLVDNPAYLGHMINDGSVLLGTDNESRTLYSASTHERHNAAFFLMEGCHFATIATKDILKDQEIFVSYGEGYWMSRLKMVNAGVVAADKTRPQATKKDGRGFKAP